MPVCDIMSLSEDSCVFLFVCRVNSYDETVQQKDGFLRGMYAGYIGTGFLSEGCR